MPPSRFSHPVVLALALAACRPGADGARPQASGTRNAAPPPFPRTGLAVSDSAHAWCAEFAADSGAPALEPGRPVTIVFPGPAAVPARRARLAAPLPGECPAEFPQPRWDGYVAYRLELTDPLRADTGESPPVALAVVSVAPWARNADGVVRADLDGDGRPEEAQRCTADEGEHLTIWSLRQEGGRLRRWHEYYDWGGFTDPTCHPGENGEGPATIEAP